MKLFVLFTLIAVAAALPRTTRIQGPGFKPQIVGGEEAGEREFPHHVSLWGLLPFVAYIPFCGGAIYDDTRIITSASCALYLNGGEYKVLAGSRFLKLNPVEQEGEQIRKVSSIIVHEAYSGATFDNDIAILTLEAPLSFTARIQPIRLAENSFVPSGSVVTSGFGVANGTDLSYTLQKATLNVINREECDHEYESVAGAPAITQNMVCATDAVKAICMGDTGSPLVARDNAGRDYLAGVVSFGANPCGGYPSVFANIAPLRPWLESKLNP